MRLILGVTADKRLDLTVTVRVKLEKYTNSLDIATHPKDFKF